MKILLTFDDKYAPHAAAVMESVIQNTKAKIDFAVMHFEENLTQPIQDKLKQHFVEKVNSLTFYPVDNQVKNLFSRIQFTEYLSLNTFLRLLSPEILKNDDVILYLDSDLIVLGDVTELMQRADLNYAINAVAEHYPSSRIHELEVKKIKTKREKESLAVEKKQMEKKKTLDMFSESSYFNAGVVILNLKLWREQKLIDQALQYISSHPVLPCGDQDVLNGIFNGNFGMLPLCWNVHPYIKLLNEYTSKYSQDELHKAKTTPKIIHFAGVKPWSYMFSNKKEKNIYWMYRGSTPWSEKIEEGKSLKNRWLKYIYHPMITWAGFFLGDNIKRWMKRIRKKQ